MEKMLLKTKKDLKKAKEFFGTKYKTNIDEAIREFPCMLIGHYADDIEFGAFYTFNTITMNDFKLTPGTVVR